MVDITMGIRDMGKKPESKSAPKVDMYTEWAAPTQTFMLAMGFAAKAIIAKSV